MLRTAGDVMVATGSSTLIMESAVVSCVAQDVLNLTNGAFSERWHSISKSCGKTADKVAVPWGQAVDPEVVRSALRRKRYDAVTVVHNETSTGRDEPDRRDRQGDPRGERRADPRGHRLFARRRAGRDGRLGSRRRPRRHAEGARRAAGPDRLHPLGARGRAGGARCRTAASTPTSCATSTSTARAASSPRRPSRSLYALDVQLDRILAEGMEARWARHERLYRRTAEWAAARGCAYASAADARSFTVSCLKPPAGVDPQAIVKGLAERGYTHRRRLRRLEAHDVPHRPHGRGAGERSRRPARGDRSGPARGVAAAGRPLMPCSGS